MTAVQPSDIEARIRALLNQEISLQARLNAFIMAMNETLGRIRGDIDRVQAERLALEQTHKGKSE